MNAASGVVKYRNIWELYSFSFLRKRLLIVIPRLTRNPASSNSVTYRNQKPLGPASIGENAADARNG